MFFATLLVLVNMSSLYIHTFIEIFFYNFVFSLYSYLNLLYFGQTLVCLALKITIKLRLNQREELYYYYFLFTPISLMELMSSLKLYSPLIWHWLCGVKATSEVHEQQPTHYHPGSFKLSIVEVWNALFGSVICYLDSWVINQLPNWHYFLFASLSLSLCG